ncbi:MAG TPA: hypothetical protein VFF06_29000, partial [Polyangia bacterium]|nr:hypothetical protein [Polyangia bacterium]
MAKPSLVIAAGPALFAAVVAFAGCAPPAAPLEPSVSSISPPLVFLARTVDVHLAGFATHWSDATTVDFGDGVTVNRVTAASATALTANVTVAPGAAVGKRDVVVSDGAVREPFKATFEIAPPIKVTLEGVEAQGSIFTLHADNLDLANLFDTTSVTMGFFGPPVFVNLAIAAPAGAQLQISSVTPFAVDATVLVDVNAPPAVADLDVVSGPPGGAQTHFPAPAALDVRARAAAALPAGATRGTVERAFDSSLFAFAPPAGAAIQDLDARVSGAGPVPAIAVLPKSGAFADLLSFGKRATLVSASADPFS